jgi:hypothetical protein
MVVKDIEVHIANFLNDDTMDFLEKLKQATMFLATQLSKIGQLFIHDIEKNAPEVWKEIEDLRHKKAFTTFQNLINEGIQKGIFRNDINPQLITLLYVRALRNIITETLSELPLSCSQAFEEIINVIFGGILTEEAREHYFATHPLS